MIFLIFRDIFLKIHNYLNFGFNIQLWFRRNYKPEVLKSTLREKFFLNNQTIYRKRKVQKEQAITIHEHALASANDHQIDERVHQLYAAIKQLKEVERALILLFLEEKS